MLFLVCIDNKKFTCKLIYGFWELGGEGAGYDIWINREPVIAYSLLSHSHKTHITHITKAIFGS